MQLWKKHLKWTVYISVKVPLFGGLPCGLGYGNVDSEVWSWIIPIGTVFFRGYIQGLMLGGDIGAWFPSLCTGISCFKWP